MAFEITNDRRSERYRNLVSRTLVEVLGPRMHYGTWAVTLRSERALLRVVIVGPDDTRHECAFDTSADPGGADLARGLRRLRIPGARRP